MAACSIEHKMCSVTSEWIFGTYGRLPWAGPERQGGDYFGHPFPAGLESWADKERENGPLMDYRGGTNGSWNRDGGIRFCQSCNVSSVYGVPSRPDPLGGGVERDRRSYIRFIKLIAFIQLLCNSVDCA
jgi:hypothetical protein